MTGKKCEGPNEVVFRKKGIKVFDGLVCVRNIILLELRKVSEEVIDMGVLRRWGLVMPAVDVGGWDVEVEEEMGLLTAWIAD